MRKNRAEIKLQQSFEQASTMREELKRLMHEDPVLQNIKNYFVTKGIDRAKIDILVNQAFRDKEEREKFISAGKKNLRISYLFLFLFVAGVAGWFFIWGDWITYFAGINFVLFLFFLQQFSSYKAKAEIYE